MVAFSRRNTFCGGVGLFIVLACGVLASADDSGRALQCRPEHPADNNAGAHPPSPVP